MHTIDLSNDDITTILDALEELSGEEADQLAKKIRTSAIHGMPATLSFGEEEE